jgi:hypothetical protein
LSAAARKSSKISSIILSLNFIGYRTEHRGRRPGV